MNIPIISTSLIKFGELWDKDISDVIGEICKKALAESLPKEKIDSAFIATSISSKLNNTSMLNSLVYENLGITNSVMINNGDSSGAEAIRQAALSIMSGESQIAIAIGIEKITDTRSNDILSLASGFLSQEEAFNGATIHSQFALITKKYIDKFNLKPNDLSIIPLMNHKHGSLNKYAQHNFEISLEKINSSPFLSEPIRMLEFAPFCDGAAAIILCNEKVSRKLTKKIKAYLIGSSLACDTLQLSKRESVTKFESVEKAANKAFEIASIPRQKIDLFEVHDIAPISEILAIEDMGFSKKGSALEFIKKNQNIINCSGGLKSCGHALGATGIRQSIDIISRLSKKKKFGLTQSMSGIGSAAIINIFKNAQ